MFQARIFFVCAESAQAESNSTTARRRIESISSVL
jgi:hypothetical protein